MHGVITKAKDLVNKVAKLSQQLWNIVYSIIPTKFEVELSSIMDPTTCGASHVFRYVEASPDPVSHTPLAYCQFGSTRHTPRALVILACQRFIVLPYGRAQGKRKTGF